MEINFESEYVSLKARWTKNDNILKPNEYIDCWSEILKYVEVLKPTYLLIDASQLDYNIISEVNLVFNEISRKLQPKNIAIILSTRVIGCKTLNNLIQYSPNKGHNTFDKISKGMQWLESCKQINFH